MTRLRLPVLVLTGLVLAGCGSEPVPDQLAAPAVLPSPSPSANASAKPGASPTTTAPTEQEPERLTAEVTRDAEALVAEGAADSDAAEVEQFVRDYYAAVNNALVTGDVAGLAPLSLPQCDYCRADVDFIRRNYERGTIEGSRTSIRSLKVQSVGPEMASVIVDLIAPDGRVVAPNGETVVLIDNGEGGLATLALFRTPDGWKIAQVLEE